MPRTTLPYNRGYLEEAAVTSLSHSLKGNVFWVPVGQGRYFCYNYFVGGCYDDYPWSRAKPKRSLTFVETIVSLHVPFIFYISFIFFLHSSAFAVKEVVVEGNQSLQSAEIVRLTGVVPGTNIFLLNEEEIMDRLTLQPLIESVQLVRKLPNRLLVRVQEREPCALLPVTEGFAVVDREGVFLTRVGHMVDISRR